MRYKDALRVLRSYDNAARAYENIKGMATVNSTSPVLKEITKIYSGAGREMRGMLKELCKIHDMANARVIAVEMRGMYGEGPTAPIPGTVANIGEENNGS